MSHDFRQGGSIPLRAIPGQEFSCEPQLPTIPAPKERMLSPKGKMSVMHHSIYYSYSRVQKLFQEVPPKALFLKNAVSLPLGVLAIFAAFKCSYLGLQRETFIPLFLQKIHKVWLLLDWVFPLIPLPTPENQCSTFFPQENLFKYPWTAKLFQL